MPLKCSSELHQSVCMICNVKLQANLASVKQNQENHLLITTDLSDLVCYHKQYDSVELQHDYIQGISQTR